jgi:putative FmdB family regulatory protein
MPTYEYACKDCSEHVEVVQSFKDDPLTECPACGGPLRKVFAPVGIVLKGSGFYKTDNRSGGSKTKSSSESKSESTSTSSSSSSDTKSESKSESKTKDKKTESKSA